MEDNELFWPKHDPLKGSGMDYASFVNEQNESKGKLYAVIKKNIENPNGLPISRLSSKGLSQFYDVQFSEVPEEKVSKYHECSNQKCKFKIHTSFRFCPKCRRTNKFYQRERGV